MSVCSDPDTQGRWKVVTGDCHLTEAITDFGRLHKHLPASTTVRVVLLPEGQSAQLEFDPARAAAEYAEHMARFATPQG